MADRKTNNTDPSNGNISAPITYTKFIHQQTEYQVFPEEFFSGSDVTVYFGDIYVDTITGIEFTLQEQLRPMYGYADYTYSDISRGNRIVQGSFRIAFKESGYLFTILEHIAQLGGKAKPALAYLQTGQDVPDWHSSARQTIEDLLDYYYDPIGATYENKTVVESVGYDWPVMQINDTDTGKSTAQATKAGFKGAVSHLQDVLIKNGYTFPAADTSGFAGLKQRFKDGDMWPTKEQMDATVAQYGNQTTKWRIHGVEHTTRFYGTNHPNGAVNWPSTDSRDPVTPYIAGRDAPVDVEKRLEARLHQYDFLRDQDAMDFNGTWGKYTDLVRHGVALFQHFAAQAPNQSGYTAGVTEAEWVESQFGGRVGWGGWVDQDTANILAKGLSTPSGVYDVATRQCVYKFQKDNGIIPTGICDRATIDKLSAKYNSKSVSVTEGTYTDTTRSGLEKNQSRNMGSRIAAYEAEVWGRELSGDVDHNRRTFFYDGGLASSGSEPQLPKLKKTGFDIFITYGPMGVWALQNVDPTKPKTYDGTLDAPGGDGKNAPFPNSVHSIRAVQIASVGQVIGADGTPIEEIYSFMARDLD